MNSVRDTNLAICRALGIDPTHVNAFELRCAADAPPTLTITSFMLDADGVCETQAFDITPRKAWDDEPLKEKPQPFDIDDACAQALHRLAVRLDYEAARCLCVLHFKSARR